MVWEANVPTLQHEQRVMVQPSSDRLSCAYARIFCSGATAGLDVQGLRRTPTAIVRGARGQPLRGAHSESAG